MNTRRSSASQEHTMSGQIRNTSNSVALNFNIRAQHLPNKRFQSAQSDDQQFVLGCNQADRYQFLEWLV